MAIKSAKNNFWKKIEKPILALAPMAGYTDSAFRRICKEHGADVTYSEMASASALFFNPEKTLELLKFKRIEKPYVVQLFGKNPEHFAKAARIICEKIKPDGIDINFGCPVKKIFKEGSGCVLMMKPDVAREIIKSVCENTKLPVSIKIRAGIKKKNALEFIENVKDLPFAAVMVHGRTYEGGFSGEVDFGIAEKIKKIIPERIVLANGGINSPQEAKNTLQKYALLDGIGIGRGSLGKPFIFEQIKEILKTGKFKDFKLQEVNKIFLRHIKLALRKDNGLKEARKHFGWYFRKFSGASEIRKRLVSATSFDEIREIID